MKYKISHTTRYEYESLASLSHNELFLTPRNTGGQTCTSEMITLLPLPSSLSRRKDFFGNRVTHTTIDIPHTTLEISAVSEIFLSPEPVMPAEQTPAWEQAKDR
ncbi:MAG: transglutaminase family protein, partial [Proteobacteria bacterium]|nr:transglutaminase family protein [Pseudomonadota bacterium]